MTESTPKVSLLDSNRHHDLPAAIPTTGIINRQDGVVTVKQKRSQAQEAIIDVVLGSTAGMAGKVIEYPFDTIKVRLQSSTRYKGPLDCLRQSVQAEGLGGLYRGISAPMVGAAIETSSLFFSYRLAQDAVERTFYPGKSRDETLPLPALLLCGAASGAFTSILLTPIELVKCQMQIPLDTYVGAAGRGPLAVVAAVYRHGGLTGFWHGQMGTLIRETGGSAAWFGTYEGIKAMFRKRATTTKSTNATVTLPIWQQMIAGACAGMAYNFAFYPADTIKSRMQTEQVGQGSIGKAKVTFMDVGKQLWREQGLRGMYRGCGITVARAAPSSAFIFSIYETLRAWLA